eukprot:398196-Alexandrium_andersonii.AAC.1
MCIRDRAWPPGAAARAARRRRTSARELPCADARFARFQQVWARAREDSRWWATALCSEA